MDFSLIMHIGKLALGIFVLKCQFVSFILIFFAV